MIRYVVVLALSASACAMAEEARSYPVGRGGKLFGMPDIDQLLARPYEPHVPMACTGERLWAAHPSGWGFGQGVHHYLHTGKNLGSDLEIKVDGKAVEPNDATCFPSHVTMTGSGNDVIIHGAKWITADDVLAVSLEMENASPASRTVTLTASLPSSAEPLPRDKIMQSWTFNQSGLTIHNLYRLPDFNMEKEKAKGSAACYREGESPTRQRGSEGPDYKAAASGGEVLGNQFGGNANDQAEWAIDVDKKQFDAILSIRYAIADAGAVTLRLEVGNQERECAFESTGGWGHSESDFRLVTLPVGNVKGVQNIRLTTVSDGSNVNIDALCIHAADVKPQFADSTRKRLVNEIKLKHGEKRSINLFHAVGARRENAEAALARSGAYEDPLKHHIETYANWVVENVPVFVSDNELTKQYWHRATSVLKKNLFRVGEGRMSRWAVAEGRWDSGWYPNMISYGGGHQIRETRWLRNPQYVRDLITTWCENEKANGVFPNFIRPDAIGDGQYTDWITATVWDAYCVEPDSRLLPLWAEALKKNVDGWLSTYDTDNDGLLLVDSHWWTGMEWQPSFFYFNGFDKDKQDKQLERVDLTAYEYGNAANLALLLDAMGDDSGAQHYLAVAEKIRDACLSILWDDVNDFFYSVEPTSHEKSMVKEVIGVYPFYFAMPPRDGKYVSVWKSILDTEQFWTTWPVASASKQCKAYSQSIAFNGKDVGGCMWNGPTWPHANSLVMSAMATTLRQYPSSPLTPDHLYALFRSFTMAQFKDHDIMFPWTGEYYNGDTAEWRTPERDYNHSTYIDIVVADIAGLRPRLDDTLEVHPLIGKDMPDFLLDGVRYHNHDVTIAWNRTDAATAPDKLSGLRVYVDGKLVHHANKPTPVTLSNFGLGRE